MIYFIKYDSRHSKLNSKTSIEALKVNMTRQKFYLVQSFMTGQNDH